MNNNEFSAIAEVDKSFADLQIEIVRIFNKYGVKSELVDELLRNLYRLEKFVSGEQNKAPDDGLDLSNGGFNSRALESLQQYEKRLTKEQC